MIGPYDKPDPSWQDGWDVFIPWELDLAMRQRERDELLKTLQGQAGMETHGGLTGLPGGIGGISGGSVSGGTTAATTATSATSSGGG